MLLFTKSKFLSLPIERQHKKCAELLRQYYKVPDNGILSNYNEIQEWIGGDLLDEPTQKTVCDKFHGHLKKAQVNLAEHNLLPTVRQGDKEVCHQQTLPIAIYLDNIRSAHNVGSILRTAEAFRLGSVYFSGMTPFIDHPQVQNTSMGTYEWITCSREKSIEQLPRPIIAIETSDHAQSIYEFIFPESFTLVMGNEEYGCSDSTLGQADFLLEIPLRGRKNSLNVANSFAIVAGEIVKQKMRIHHEKF